VARKHRVSAAELGAHLESLEQRLAEIERGDERLAALEAEAEAHRRRYEALAETLHDARLAAAPRLAEAIAANVRELGMAGARFAVEVQPAPASEPGPTGRDRVEFLVSANPGLPLAPLAQVASGGELSRVSLAIQLIGAAGRGVPTQVFDEVDSGVGGRVAEVVGAALHRLAGGCQVLCVTHLPQVAARGHHHLEVRKGVRGGATFATVSPLAGDTRVQEVARMLGGLEVTERALAHAREMLERAVGA
jgi:DNA repair protein RecN (Recombination protein N)